MPSSGVMAAESLDKSTSTGGPALSDTTATNGLRALRHTRVTPDGIGTLRSCKQHGTQTASSWQFGLA